MNEPYQQALRYLSVPAGSFWTWADQGSVITWNQGRTITFRQELAEILSRLCPRGLPPLDGVIILLAATHADSDIVPRLSQLLSSHGDFNVETASVMRILNSLYSLRDDFMRVPHGKANLADFVFAGVSPALTGEAARAVCEILTDGQSRGYSHIPSLVRLRGGRIQTSRTVREILDQMRPGLELLSSDALQMHRRTGLIDVPETIDLDLPVPPATVRALVDRLAFDPELGGLCRIARHVSAVIDLPRTLIDRDEMPLGGVSDIANVGTLDRLLLSELAHDDLMLSARIALREALYLRREAPPAPPPQHRSILVDAGLRLWGLPRLFATAALLSLASSARAGAEVQAYVARGASVIPIDLTSREGLVWLLEFQAPEIDAGGALPAFFARIPPGESHEAIVITSCESLEDHEFLRQLRDCPDAHVAAVDRDGTLRLVASSPRGLRLLKSATWDLQDLLTAPVSTVRDDSFSDWPALLRRDQLPFRLPYIPAFNSNRETAWSVRLRDPGSPTTAPAQVADYGVLILTRDRRLLLYDHPTTGTFEVAHSLPFGKCLWHGVSHDCQFSSALIQTSGEKDLCLLTVDLLRRQLVASPSAGSCHRLRKEPILGATLHEGTVLTISARRVEALRSGDLQPIGQMELPPNSEWNGGRYFSVRDPQSTPRDSTGRERGPTRSWMAVTMHGSRLDLEYLFPIGDFSETRLFDRLGHDGPFGIRARGQIINFATRQEYNAFQFGSDSVEVLEICPEGRRALIRHRPQAAPGKQIPLISVYDLDIQQGTFATAGTSSLCQFDLAKFLHGTTLISRLSSVHRVENHLIVTTRNKVHRQLILQSGRLSLKQIPALLTGDTVTATFEQVRHPNPGCSLWLARFADGSRVYADSRGLLHLRSSEASVPEATLVLDERNVAVWISTDRRLAIPYYCDDSEIDTLAPEEFQTTVLQPFLERLR